MTRLISSPFGRARTTAEVIAAACGATLVLRDGLAEMSFGVCAGLTLDEVIHGLGACGAEAMTSGQSAAVLMRLDADGTLWHARLDGGGGVPVWTSGPP